MKILLGLLAAVGLVAACTAILLIGKLFTNAVSDLRKPQRDTNHDLNRPKRTPES